MSPASGGGHSAHPVRYGVCPMRRIALRPAPAELGRLATIKWINIHDRWYKMIKRSVRVSGHPTSVSVEDAFWQALSEIATARATTIAKLIDEIDAERGTHGLSSAIRLYVLEYYRARGGHAGERP